MCLRRSPSGDSSNPLEFSQKEDESHASDGVSS